MRMVCWFGVFLLFALKPWIPVLGVHLLIFGDSIDRLSLYHYCEQGGVLHGDIRNIDWQFNETVAAHMSVHCHTRSNDIISFVHIYGAKPDPPYQPFQGRIDSEISTIHRIPKGLEIFRKKFGRYPDRILFHTTKWEKHSSYLFEHIIQEEPGSITKIAVKREAMKVFERYTLHWIEYFQSLAKSNPDLAYVKLMLRTVPVSGDMFLLELLNDVMRTLVRRPQLSWTSPVYLYDMHEDIWWLSEYDQIINKQMFLDATHPCRLFLIRYMEKMLGLRYSAHITRNEGHLSLSMSPSSSTALDFFSSYLSSGDKEKLWFPRRDLCSSSITTMGSLRAIEQLLFHCPGVLLNVLQIIEVPSFRVGQPRQIGKSPQHQEQGRALSNDSTNINDGLFVFTAVSPINHKRYYWRGIDRNWMKSQLLTEGDIFPIPSTLFDKIVATSAANTEESLFKGDLNKASAYQLFQETATYRIKYDGNHMPMTVNLENLQDPKFARGKDHCLFRSEQTTSMYAMSPTACEESSTISTQLINIQSSEDVALLYWKFGVSMYSDLFYEGVLVAPNTGMASYSWIIKSIRYRVGRNKTAIAETMKEHNLSKFLTDTGKLKPYCCIPYAPLLNGIYDGGDTTPQYI